MRLSKSGGRFVKNAAVLTATSLLLKAAGMCFRVYASARIGAAGMGLYQMLLSVYTLFAGFASSGLTVASTRMVAGRLALGDHAGARRVLRVCLTVSLSAGLLSAVLLELFAAPVANGWISDPRALVSVRVMAAALPFMGVSCCLRGYFTARRRVGVSSASQITEQLSRILLAVLLLRRMLSFGVAAACLAIMLADVISEAAGCLHIALGYLRDRARLRREAAGSAARTADTSRTAAQTARLVGGFLPNTAPAASGHGAGHCKPYNRYDRTKAAARGRERAARRMSGGSLVRLCNISAIRRDGRRGIYRELWGIALPITASHYLTSLLRTVESILVPDCLTRHTGSRELALELFGMVKGMALPLLLFPSAFLGALSMLLVPEISEAYALGQAARVKRAVGRSMTLTMSLSAVAAAVFVLFPDELGVLLYREPALGRVLFALAPLTPLMYAESVAVGILRGLGEQRASLVYGAADSALRIALISLLVPRAGLGGFLAVMAVSNLLTPALSIRKMLKAAGMRFDLVRWALLPAGCFGGALLLGAAAERLWAAIF